MSNSPDSRSPTAVAWAWASHATSIALEMVVPGMLGFWIDRRLGTVMVFLVLGVILGMVLGMMHLIRFATSMKPGGPPTRVSSRSHGADEPRGPEKR